MQIAFTKMHGIGNSDIYLDLFQHDYKEDIFCELAQKNGHCPYWYWLGWIDYYPTMPY